MSTVKLITTYSDEIYKKLSEIDGVRVLDMRAVSYNFAMSKIFSPYEGKVVILGDFRVGDLPVPTYVYVDSKELHGDDLRNFIMNNYSTRTYSADGNLYYDVYKIWYICRYTEPQQVNIRKLMLRNYGSADLAKIAPWGGKNISEMTDDDPDKILIMKSDLSYPIIIRYGNYIVDGHHRIIHAYLLGRERCDAKFITSRQLGRAVIAGNIDNYEKKF